MPGPEHREGNQHRERTGEQRTEKKRHPERPRRLKGHENCGGVGAEAGGRDMRERPASHGGDYSIPEQQDSVDRE